MLSTWETWKYPNEKGTCMLFDVFYVISSRNLSMSHECKDCWRECHCKRNAWVDVKEKSLVHNE